MLAGAAKVQRLGEPVVCVAARSSGSGVVGSSLMKAACRGEGEVPEGLPVGGV